MVIVAKFVFVFFLGYLTRIIQVKVRKPKKNDLEVRSEVDDSIPGGGLPPPKNP